ncbi:NADP-dependent 3-hydroxy acid dehydrogenase YdfG [Coccomyxa sp. Obi]|nr:NADP-dependent 3-hydroxy acid dehydrogenase YdfG [Coccomyxa sp. Obi]
MPYRVLALKDKIVLITGASSGIGRAAAKQFAEIGAKLILVARRDDRLQILKKELEEEHKVEAHTVAIDLQDLDRVQALVPGLPDNFKEVDVLVNNAGLALGKAPAHQNDIGDVATMLDTNCKSLVVLTQQVAEGMVKRNWGHIINVSSIAAHDHYAGGSVYCGTKAFVAAFTNATRHDLVGTNVRVTAISPGAVQTEFSNVRFKGDDQAADSVYAGIVPLTAADIADQIVYAATRPSHVQIGEIVSYATYQASPTNIARVLLQK